MTLHDLRYGMYPYLSRVQYPQVRVWCLNSRPVVYPWKTLILPSLNTTSSSLYKCLCLSCDLGPVMDQMLTKAQSLTLTSQLMIELIITLTLLVIFAHINKQHTQHEVGVQATFKTVTIPTTPQYNYPKIISNPPHHHHHSRRNGTHQTKNGVPI